MTTVFLKPNLSKEQKLRLQALNTKNDFLGFLSILIDVIWIGVAVWLSISVSMWLYPVSILVIGARQRALASLLHEAAHTTLFKTQALNSSIGRVVCGWTILQSYGAYRTSHVLNHHPKIGSSELDPDLVYMPKQGVYDRHSPQSFLRKFFVLPILGGKTFGYIHYLIKDRFIAGLSNKTERFEIVLIILFHAVIFSIAIIFNWWLELLLFWWMPFLVVHPIIGWFSELAEHYPMMDLSGDTPRFYSRNRYAGFFEKIFIGMHSDNLHLTHHLFPAIPHWNLQKATQILKEDESFCRWDNYWGGIFSSSEPSKVSLLDYIKNEKSFANINLTLSDNGTKS